MSLIGIIAFSTNSLINYPTFNLNGPIVIYARNSFTTVVKS